MPIWRMLGHVIVIHKTTNRVKRQFLGRKIFNSLVIHKPLDPEQECKFLLSIGGEICNFTPILPYFQRWGDQPRHDCFQVSKLSTEQKKQRSSPKMDHFFYPNSSGDLRSDTHQSQIIGGDADVDHTQIIGGIQ